jgi:YjjG family noncanonical pyrimidine nucleotidase
MFQQYDWLLFDLDNTLLNFNESAYLAFTNLCEIHQIEDSKSAYLIYKEINAKYWHYFEKHKINANELRVGRFESFLKAINNQKDAAILAQDYTQLLVEHSQWITGAENALKHYSKTHSLALITNGLQDVQMKRLAKHQMFPYFKKIFISEELGASKPQKDFFEKVHAAIQNPQKNKVLVIGDNLKADIKGAKNFQYHACWFNYHQESKKKIPTHFSIHNWNEALAV